METIIQKRKLGNFQTTEMRQFKSALRSVGCGCTGVWQEYRSKACATDSELIEMFDYFAFEAVIGDDQMESKTRAMS